MSLKSDIGNHSSSNTIGQKTTCSNIEGETMPIPLHGRLEVPLLEELAKAGGSAKPRQMYDVLASRYALTSHERNALTTKDGDGRSLWRNHVRQVRGTLVQNGEDSNASYGVWQVTQEGYARLRRNGIQVK